MIGDLLESHQFLEFGFFIRKLINMFIFSLYP